MPYACSTKMHIYSTWCNLNFAPVHKILRLRSHLCILGMQNDMRSHNAQKNESLLQARGCAINGTPKHHANACVKSNSKAHGTNVPCSLVGHDFKKAHFLILCDLKWMGSLNTTRKKVHAVTQLHLCEWSLNVKARDLFIK